MILFIRVFELTDRNLWENFKRIRGFHINDDFSITKEFCLSEEEGIELGLITPKNQRKGTK